EISEELIRDLAKWVVKEDELNGRNAPAKNFMPGEFQNRAEELKAYLDERDRLQGGIEKAESDVRQQEYHLNQLQKAPPDYPFKNNAWVELIFKRELRRAVDDGMDRLAWERGIHQIERWSHNLRRKVDAIVYRKTEKGLEVSVVSEGSEQPLGN